MDRLKELIEVLSDEAVQARTLSAKASHSCKICGNTATTFNTILSEFEYHNSIICEDCQIYFYRYDN